MNKQDLINKNTHEVLRSLNAQKAIIKLYIVLSLCFFIYTFASLHVKNKEIELLRNKAKNDSLAVQSLKNNLLHE